MAQEEPESKRKRLTSELFPCEGGICRVLFLLRKPGLKPQQQESHGESSVRTVRTSTCSTFVCFTVQAGRMSSEIPCWRSSLVLLIRAPLVSSHDKQIPRNVVDSLHEFLHFHFDLHVCKAHLVNCMSICFQVAAHAQYLCDQLTLVVIRCSASTHVYGPAVLVRRARARGDGLIYQVLALADGIRSGHTWPTRATPQPLDCEDQP